MNSKLLIQDCIKRGWVFDGNTYWPPNSPQAVQLRLETGSKSGKNKTRLKGLKTGWIDDYRNICNKEKNTDIFIHLVKQELKLEVWPEFYFSTERNYRFDYAIPEYKIAIEQEGGIWAKGNSGHSSGKGIQRDMDKASLAAVNGWVLIRRTPQQLCTMETLELIKQAIKNKQL